MSLRTTAWAMLILLLGSCGEEQVAKKPDPEVTSITYEDVPRRDDRIDGLVLYLRSDGTGILRQISTEIIDTQDEGVDISDVPDRALRKPLGDQRPTIRHVIREKRIELDIAEDEWEKIQQQFDKYDFFEIGKLENPRRPHPEDVTIRVTTDRGGNRNLSSSEVGENLAFQFVERILATVAAAQLEEATTFESHYYDPEYQPPGYP